MNQSVNESINQCHIILLFTWYWCALVVVAQKVDSLKVAIIYKYPFYKYNMNWYAAQSSWLDLLYSVYQKKTEDQAPAAMLEYF